MRRHTSSNSVSPTDCGRGAQSLNWKWLASLAAWSFLTLAANAQELSSPRAADVSTAPLNLHFVVAESLINQLVARQDVQSGEVRDVFEDTPISGQQLTLTNTRVDLLPSNTQGRILILLYGDSASSTAGFSPQAVVTSVGHQQFLAQKEILFDGYQLATRRAEVSVLCTDQHHTGAMTKFTGSPIGPLAEQIALSVAQKKQPAADAFARRRIVEKVYPRFNGELDEQLARGNVFLKETLQARLETVQLMPQRVRMRTTDSHLYFSAAVAAPLEVATLPPCPDELVAPHAASVYMHESLMQGVIERSGLAGRKVDQRDLYRLMRLVGLTVDEPSLPGMEHLRVEIQFADVDPLEIRLGTDEARVTMRAAFHAAGQEVLPAYEVTVPFRIVEQGDNWFVKNGNVEIRGLNGSSDGSSITELAARKVIEASLPKITFPKQLPADAWPAGKTPPRITSFRSGNGWVVVGVD